jgi:3-dehydro-L-gulonate 2-dehydrogenase
LRIQFNEMKETIRLAFIKAGMSEVKAEACARIHTESSCDGVYSHGLNRVSKFAEYIKTGLVNSEGEPILIQQMGSIENYDGNMGPGILNAQFTMDRAIDLASAHGMGLATLKNTTHWMRGGSYGWQAVQKGFIGICWTNTESCMPAWGSISSSVGNNPFVMAVPNGDSPLVLDMAMSQYSYGKLEVTRQAGATLPYPGGYDKEGILTDNPGEIEETRRILPMGYWKGSGFSILLDMVASLLSGGLATAGIDANNAGNCGGCSQIFMAFDPEKFGGSGFMEATLKQSIEHLHSAIPETEGGSIYYPGERTILTRKENRELGIPVNEKVWNEVSVLAGKSREGVL